LDSPPDVLLFRRDPNLLCAVNISDTAWPLPEHERILLASEPPGDGMLAPDTAVWLAV
jgi:alpha-glucosidase